MTNSTTGAWLGFYTKYHFNEKWAYHGEYHLRRRNGEYGFKDMAQIYLRFGATYKLAKYLDVTAGVVTPFYWAPREKVKKFERQGTEYDQVVNQFRFWEQFVLATPFDHIKVLHQLRVEQRWRRPYEKAREDQWDLTHRFRYKLTVYVPLFKNEFGPRSWFISLYDEIFLQAGSSVTYNHFEDNRLFAGLGRNLGRSWQVQAGYMLSFRHQGPPIERNGQIILPYEDRHIVRFSLYHHLDFHLDRQPKVRDIPIH